MEPRHPDLELDLLATVFDVARIGICVVDEAGKFIRVNPAFCQMVNYREEELIGQSYAITAPPSVVAVKDKFLRAALDDSPKIPREWKIQPRHGEMFDALVSFRPILRADGERFVVITFSDISDSKNAQAQIEAMNRELEQRIAARTAELTQKIEALKIVEEALRESEERARLIFETARDSVVTMSENGDITGWNRQAYVMFGWKREEAFGKCFWELLLPVEQHRSFAQRLQRFSAGGDPNALNQTLELTAVRSDGHEFPVEISLWSAHSAGKLFFSSFIRDISIRKGLEAEARARNERMLLHRDRLLELAQLNKTDFDFALRRILEVEARTLGVERVSYWSLAADHSVIRCERLFRRSLGEMDECAGELQLRAENDPHYFGLITANRPVISTNAQEDPGVGGDTLRYFREQKITATLDAPVWFQGRVVGALSNEHVGPPRQWGAEDIDFANASANMISLALEASSRVKAQAELVQSERKYRQVIDVTREGFWLLNANNETIEVNSALCRMLGFDREELLGRTPFQFLDEQGRADLAQKVAYRPHSISGTFEMTVYARDGQPIPTIVNAAIIVNEQGEREFSFAFVTNISERKRLERDLQQTLWEQDAILQSSMVGIALLKGRTFQWVNRALEQQIFGFAEGEMVGKTTEICYASKELYAQIGQEAYPLLAKGGVFETEVRMQRRDGNLFWCYITGRAIKATDLSVGTIWVLMDITRRKQGEADVLQALEREKDVSELKSRFVSMTSHEFRTPLAAIMSSTELLSDYGDRLPTDEKSELIQVIKSSVKRMTQMLEDILVIGRADAGRLEFAPQMIDLKALCLRLIEEVRASGDGSHEIRFDYQDEALRPHNLDERLLRHILTNLLLNAMKYSPQGGEVELEVNCGEREVRFVVRDQGIGIPREDQANLFQAFHRGRNVANISGTGLGLAIVKKAVDLHGGSISVKSDAGKGACFAVRLAEPPGVHHA